MNALDFYLRATVFYGFCWTCMVTLNLVYMVEVAGLDPLQMVLVGTALEVAAFIFEIPTGVVADVVSRRLSVVIGHALTGLGFLVLALFPSFEMILLSQVIWGLGWTFISGAYPAWLTDEIGVEAANRAFARAAQYSQVGALLGIATAIGLGHFALRTPILVGACGVLGLAVVMQLRMPETGFRAAAPAARASWAQMGATFVAGARTVRAQPLLTTIFAITLVYGAFTEGFDRLWTPFLIENFAFPEIGALAPVTWWGILAAVATMASFLVTRFARRHIDIEDHRTLTWALALMTATIGGVAILLAQATGFFWAVACYWLLTAVRAARGPFATAWLNRELPSGARATLLSMNGQADAVGQTLGGPMIGWVAKEIAISVALTASALILLPSMWLYRKAAGLGVSADAEASTDSRSGPQL
jgi:DHA3 family tetracycline resistance protein-like MFS transporter